jgi:hypothetical protein
MPMTDAMLTWIAKAIIGETQNAFDGTYAYIGVGDSNATFNSSHTDLQATSNKLRKAMDTGFPSRSNLTLTFQATFGDEEANFDWLEWALFNAGTGGTMANRKQENKGTKNGGSWVFKVELTPALGTA